MTDPQRTGRLVVIEGIDGAGKSTVLRHLSDYCTEHGIPAVISREPTNGKWGSMLRESARTGRLSLSQELELFIQDRAEHVETLIAPALAEGKVVLLDRYYFSTAAYQGARGADPQEIIATNEHFAPTPDLVLLLDLNPIVGRERITGRGDSPDGFEELDELRKVREIFLSIERPYFEVVDASRPADEVLADCIRHFEHAIAGLAPVE